MKSRLPCPSEKPPGMSRSSWCRARKQGWYCPDYRQREMALGVSQITIGDLRAYALAIAHRMLAQYGGSTDPAVWDAEALAHAGIVRLLEVQADQRAASPGWCGALMAHVMSGCLRTGWHRGCRMTRIL